MCSQPGVTWYPQRSTCYATAAKEVAERMWSARLRGEDYRHLASFDPQDGTHVWVSTEDLNPGDHFI